MAQALLDSLVESLPSAPAAASGQLPTRGSSTPGAVKPPPRNCGSIRCRPPVPMHLLQALLGDDVATGRSPLQPLKQLLIARTEGNPFFLEESVRTLVETGALVGRAGAPTARTVLCPTMQVPATVQAVLAARIDRLSARGQASPPDRGRHWHGGALPPAAGHGRGVRRGVAPRPRLTCKRRSCSTRRGCFPSVPTPSSMP